MWFTRISLRNPVLATMLMLAIVVLGLFSYQRLKVAMFPDVDLPVVVITVDYPGASPEIVESEVTRRIEESVNTVAGISALRSRSYEGLAVVVVEFEMHVDGRKAAQDVRERLAAVRPLLRTEVKEPRVLRFDPASRPVWSLALLPDQSAGGAAPDALELGRWARQTLKKRLENVRGVGAVILVGASWREINLYLKPQALEAHGLTPEQIANAVRGESQDQPLGALRSTDQERAVQLDARMQRPEDFGRIIVARKAGAPLRLEQVARVHDGAQELDNLALYNGERTLLVLVQKAQDENTIEVVDALEAAVAELRHDLPPGLRLESVGDSARPIRVAVRNVRETLIEGALLTVLIVFLFLNSWRSTVITGLTLPIALIGTFWFMQLFGFTINMITLMALSLCVGLLIDDAIVVRENIVRHLQMGKSAYAAALEGTQEIGLAVLATTLSIVAVFLPIGFMGGVIGKFFHEFGLTIVAAVLISMFVSFTLDPMLSSLWHDPSIATPGRGSAGPRSLYDKSLGRVTAGFDRATTALTGLYQQILRWSLRHKLTTLALALGVFVLSLVLLPLLGSEFVPKADFSETSISFQTPVGSSLEATEAKARQVQALLRELPEVRYSLATINTGNATGKNSAEVFVRLVDRSQRSRSVEQMTLLLRERLVQLPGISVTHVGLLDPVTGNKQIEFSLQGNDQRELTRLAQRVIDKLRGIPGLVDLDSSAKPDKPVIALEPRRDAASDLGLGAGQLGAALRTLIAGSTLGSWRAPDDQSYDVNLRLAPEARSTVQDLERLPFALPTAEGGTRIVHLGQVARVRETTGAHQINRRDLNREVAVSANAAQRSAGEVSADIRKALDALAFPPGYRYRFGGSTKNMSESFDYALAALAMALIFIYMILASQFRSFVQPLALMSALPLTLIGVVLALLLFGSTLSLFSVIGVVMLMGLVTKNAILLVDFAIRARQEHVDEQGRSQPGLPRTEALLLAARVRLRPILMTTLAMVFGMLPLALALSEGSEQRAPMGQAVAGGVITASLLTLVVVPVVYCYMDDLARWALRKLGRDGASKIVDPS